MAGKQTSELLLVRRGAIDFALASTINWSPQIKELNLTALPFFVANNPDRYKAIDAIEAGKSGKMLEKAIEKTGVKFLGWSENGFRELTTSKGPIEKPEDMKGMKLRVCGTPIFIDIFSSLGANPRPSTGLKLSPASSRASSTVRKTRPTALTFRPKFGSGTSTLPIGIT